LIQVGNILKFYQMKNFLSSTVAAASLVFLLSIVPQLTFAQLGDPGEDPDAPIDGGLSLLVAAGVGYGIKKANDQRKKDRASTGAL